MYILSSMYAGEEYFLYSGKSKAQYARQLTHSKNYAYDHIYLFECEPEYLTESEAAVIAELCPLFNRDHNPMAVWLNQILQIDYESKQNEKMIHHYLERYAKYKRMGLFGFALPGAVFSALAKQAEDKNCTCSEILQRILEDALGDNIINALEDTETVPVETNLVTTKVYAKQNSKSTEQIKQYLHQMNRLPGAAKIGRDWVLPQDTRFPKDLRGSGKK